MTLADKICDILIQLRVRPHTCRELCERLQIPKSTVKWAVAILYDRGFLERSRATRQFGMGSPPYKYWLASTWAGQ